MKYRYNVRLYDSNSAKNLIKFGEMDVDRQRELSRRGGVASGNARRRKRALIQLTVRQLEILMLRELVTNAELEDFKKWRKEQRKKERQQMKRGGTNGESV